MTGRARIVGARGDVPRSTHAAIGSACQSGALLVAIAAGLASCARQSASGSESPKGGSNSEILVSTEAYEGGEQVLAACLGYGLAKMQAYQEHPPPAANENLSTLEAFCAVERKSGDAMRVVSRAVALRPSDPGSRLELSLLLTATNRPDEALAQVTRAMELTTDGCAMGLAWRRRGYILVEKGALDAAESAYRMSLKYDPKNRIAHSELATIDKMRRERRSRTPDPVVTAVPPFGMTVTECGAAKSD